MKIASSDLTLHSQHQSLKEHERHERLLFWKGERPSENTLQAGNTLMDNRVPGQGQGGQPSSIRALADQLELSVAAQAAQPKKAVAAAGADPEVNPIGHEDQLKISLLIRMIESLTGKKLNLAPPGEFAAKMSQARSTAEATAVDFSGLQGEASGEIGAQNAGFGIEYDLYERHYESETTHFSAQGQVRTTDGQSIDISVELNMSREFLREQSLSIRAGDAQLKDPLVINFGGHAAELTTTRFAFDIDSDGRLDQIAFVGPNSGFLALDRNQDGKINDGSELFGPKTGNGFAELAKYDEDGNGWIDEADSVYKNLRIWSKTSDGQDQLVGLGERGIGAIYLGHITTPFDLKDQDNELLGQIRSSSIFLTTKGSAGTIQQIDLAV